MRLLQTIRATIKLMETHGVSKVIQVALTYPTVTSKMLLPTELDTAMSPKPFRATITDVIRSGIEVPAAKNVSPITCKEGRVEKGWDCNNIS